MCLLERHIDNIDWCELSLNPSAVDLLERNIDKINWRFLARNPSAVDLLRRHPEKIDWYVLSYNPSLFTYDYVAMKNSTSLFHEELIQKVLHPRRLIKYLEEYDYDIASEEYYSTF